MKIIFTIAFTFVIVFCKAQSPWVQQAGSTYVQIGYSIIPFYNKVFTGHRTFDYVPRYIKDEVFQVYAEAGITSNTSLIVNIPYLRLTSGAFTGADTGVYHFRSGSINGLGNSQVALRTALYKKRGKLMSLQARVQLPSGIQDRATGLTLGYDCLGFQVLYAVGKTNQKGTHYVFGYAGAQYNTDKFSSYVHAGMESGLKWKNRLWLIAFIDVVQSLNNGTREYLEKYQMTYTYVNNQNYGAYGGKISGEFIRDNYGFNASFAGGVFNKNVAKKPSFSLSLFAKFN